MTDRVGRKPHDPSDQSSLKRSNLQSARPCPFGEDVLATLHQALLGNHQENHHDKGDAVRSNNSHIQMDYTECLAPSE